MRDDGVPAPPGLTAVEIDEDLVCLVLPERPPVIPACLTDAEGEVARLLFQGLSNAQIAGSRGTGVRTVGKQVSAILRKLGVSSRYELVLALLPVDGG